MSHFGIVLLALLLGTAAISLAQGPALLEVGKFSAAIEGSTLPDGWKPLTFKKIERHTQYEVIKDGPTLVVKAISEAAASGLTKEVMIDPREYPIVRWRWKVENLLQKSDVSRKDGDDYPARIYITFAYESDKVRLGENSGTKPDRRCLAISPSARSITFGTARVRWARSWTMLSLILPR